MFVALTALLEIGNNVNDDKDISNSDANGTGKNDDGDNDGDSGDNNGKNDGENKIKCDEIMMIVMMKLVLVVA